MPKLRSMLVLGRVSNLPTVWSNCLAGWWLGGGGHPESLPFLFAGASLLYLGGMFLNDAFDVEFDREFRKERPIPAGTISLVSVWRLGLAGLATGALCLIAIGWTPGALGLLLTVCILAYNAVHKRVSWAPALMGLCRTLLYVIAASVGLAGVTGWALWCGLALGIYVIAVSALARRENLQGSRPYAALIFLATPIALAWIMNADSFRRPALLLSAILALWIVRSLRPVLWSVQPEPRRTVSHLLAGIVFVDLLAVAGGPQVLSMVFFGLFLAAVLLQRVVPAT